MYELAVTPVIKVTDIDNMRHMWPGPFDSVSINVVLSHAIASP